MNSINIKAVKKSALEEVNFHAEYLDCILIILGPWKTNRSIGMGQMQLMPMESMMELKQVKEGRFLLVVAKDVLVDKEYYDLDNLHFPSKIKERLAKSRISLSWVSQRHQS